ncbi:hypothetical protein HYU40_00560 [Candidatus Woesearchaeota archaeon]|nr:hypothetical protein [Candidatus Woesearchaeota archaeon]
MKRFVGKRGIEKATLVLLISAVALLLFYLLSVFKGASNAAESSADLAACKGSVLRNAQLRISGIEFPTDIRCPARNVVIKNTKEPKDQKAAKETIAKEMYYCWDQYGKGRLNLFKDEAVFCAVCSFINIDSDTPVTGLPDYLMNTQIPGNSGTLYYSYLAGFQTDNAQSVLGDAFVKDPKLRTAAEELSLEKGNHAVVFVYAKGKDEIEKVVRQLTLQTTYGKAGMAIGATSGVAVAGTIAIAFGVSNPIGWVALGAGAVTWGGVELVTLLISPDNVPEWATFTTLIEWNGENTAKALQSGFGCDNYPVPLE